MAGIDASTWLTLASQGGSVTVVLLVGWLIFTGRLRTASNVTEIREDRDARLKEAKELADIWMEAYYKLEAARAANERMLQESLDNSRAALKLLESIRNEDDDGSVG